MKESKLKKSKFETLCIHGGGDLDPQTGAVSQPIHQSSTFAFHTAKEGAEIFAGEKEGYFYSRITNPTVRAFEKQVAILEEGEDAIGFSSGMAAISSLILSYVKAGEKIVSSDTVYGGTYDLFHETLPELDIEVKMINATDLSEVENALDERTRFLFIETPANPSLSVIDIEACSRIANKRGIPLVVDNTFATPYFQKPLKLGANFVLHSASKYLGGHSDLIGGVVVGQKEDILKVRLSTGKNLGPTMAPFTAWLLLRGLKTLPVRMEQHQKNAFKIAHFLNSHPAVEKVFYPGLESHPQHEIAKKQMSGYSGMLSFELKGGRSAGEALMNSVKLITLAVSLGGVDSLIEHPPSMTHSGYSIKDLEDAGISQGLVRLSVGLENADDLINDLSQAMEYCL